jgi:hypothetical protein
LMMMLIICLNCLGETNLLGSELNDVLCLGC